MTRPDRSSGTALVFIGQGFSFAAVVGVLAFIGYKLDAWLGTEPWLLVTGTLVGVAAATFDLLRTARAYERRRGREGQR